MLHRLSTLLLVGEGRGRATLRSLGLLRRGVGEVDPGRGPRHRETPCIEIGGREHILVNDQLDGRAHALCHLLLLLLSRRGALLAVGGRGAIIILLRRR